MSLRLEAAPGSAHWSAVVPPTSPEILLACVTRRSRAALLASTMAMATSTVFPSPPAPEGTAWPRHAIDASGRGADGTKLADINGDGRPDITTGWEEDGSTRVYLNPGLRGLEAPWPRVIVGSTPSAEDAVFADLDGDGNVDVVSSCEGGTRQVFVHWSPHRAALLDGSAWRQESFPALRSLTRWMFGQPSQIDGRHGTDLVLGGKNGGGAPGSVLGWLEAPAAPRDVGAWRWHPLTDTGWVMSIEMEDMDGDGDRDILYGDRVGMTRGIWWLENPGPGPAAAGAPWARHAVDGTGRREIMFLDTGDLDGDGLRDVVAGVIVERTDQAAPDRASRIGWYRRADASGRRWTETLTPVPANTGSIKGVAVGDVDGDGRPDLVATCENASRGRIGVYWLRNDGSAALANWRPVNIAGPAGIKFDLVRLLDLDEDGDLDVLTNEEREGGGGLGVVWYENPRRAGRERR